MTTNSEQTPVLAPERLTVENAAALLEQVRASAAAGADVRIDLAAVKTADTAGIQLLAVARRCLQRDGRQCHLLGPTETILEAAALLGVRHLLTAD